MRTLSPDTSPEIERIEIERLRQMSACRKSELAARVYGPGPEDRP